jgi:hypothetical protein
MFTSNQEFVITGDSKEALSEVIRCALTLNGSIPDLSGITRIKSFRQDEKGLSFSGLSKSACGYTDIPFPMAIDALVEQIYVYLASDEARKTYSALRDKAYSGDGGLENGWRVYHDSSGWASVFTVQPFLTYYSK